MAIMIVIISTTRGLDTYRKQQLLPSLSWTPRSLESSFAAVHAKYCVHVYIPFAPSHPSAAGTDTDTDTDTATAPATSCPSPAVLHLLIRKSMQAHRLLCPTISSRYPVFFVLKRINRSHMYIRAVATSGICWTRYITKSYRTASCLTLPYHTAFFLYVNSPESQVKHRLDRKS